MKTVDISEAAAGLPIFVQGLRETSAEPVLITENGKPVAALVGVGGIDLESVSLSSNSAFLDIIEKSRARHQKEGGTSSTELRRRFARQSAKPAQNKKSRRR